MEVVSSERFSSPGDGVGVTNGGLSDRKVGILYDERMCKHHTSDGDYHPENPNRIRVIWEKLQSAGIPQRCVVLNAKKAEDKYIMAVHSKNHVNLIKNISSKEYDSRRDRIASKLNSIYLNKGSSEAAYLACGSVVDVTERVAKGELNSGVAIVRPPGHHAEQDEAMGFCLLNNVAVAASYILNERPELDVKKILIVDWDVHHGNATQKMFWEDPHVLFFLSSQDLCRHEFGTFYPSTDDGFYTMTGEGKGAGFNINVPWENARCGDADYFAVWDHILIPVVKEYNPDLIIVSAGFDAAVNDPLGGCRVTPSGYATMLKKLMGFAQGKIVLALEGGYNLDSIANSMLACVEVLLDNAPITASPVAYPFESTWRVIQAVRQELSPFWPVLSDKLPKELISQNAPQPVMPQQFFHLMTDSTNLLIVIITEINPSSNGLKATEIFYDVKIKHVLILSSDSEVEDEKDPNLVSSDNLDVVLDGVIEPMTKLKVDEDNLISYPWRSELSRTDIWYATYGSNMWTPRFLCYIEGGQVEEMKRVCPGSADKTPPKEICWQTFPHRLFFGHEFSHTWGPGGVAFVNPQKNLEEKTPMRLYKITLEQFNDILLQENNPRSVLPSPLFSAQDLDDIAREELNFFKVPIEWGWYRNVVYLGKNQDIPILTMTCSGSDMDEFRNGKLPVRAPAKNYANTLIRGLVEGLQLSAEEATFYVQRAIAEPL